MPKVVDARNLACPEPVVLTIKALEEADEVVTIVNSDTARENVSRLGRSRGCEVAMEQKEDGTWLTLRKPAPPAAPERPPATATVLLIASDTLGRGDNHLGSRLMQSFLHTLGALTSRPETIIFINNGVKLVANDSLVLEDLRRLESQGVEVLACGTCVAHFKIDVAVGQVSNMHTIADTLLRAGKVVAPFELISLRERGGSAFNLQSTSTGLSQLRHLLTPRNSL